MYYFFIIKYFLIGRIFNSYVYIPSFIKVINQDEKSVFPVLDQDHVTVNQIIGVLHQLSDALNYFTINNCGLGLLAQVFQRTIF